MTEEIKKQLLLELFAKLNSSNTTDSNSSSSSDMSDASRDYSIMEAVKEILETLQPSYIAAVYDIKNLIDEEGSQAIEEIESFLNNPGNVEIKNKLVGHRLDLGIDVDPKTKKIFWKLADEYFKENPELLMEGFSEALEQLKQIRTRKEEAMANMLDDVNSETCCEDNDRIAAVIKALDVKLNSIKLSEFIDKCKKDSEIYNKGADYSFVIDGAIGLRDKDNLSWTHYELNIMMVNEVFYALLPDYISNLREMEHLLREVREEFSEEKALTLHKCMNNQFMQETGKKLAKHELDIVPAAGQISNIKKVLAEYGLSLGANPEEEKENFWLLAEMAFKHKPLLLMNIDQYTSGFHKAVLMPAPEISELGSSVPGEVLPNFLDGIPISDCLRSIRAAREFLKVNEKNTSEALLPALDECITNLNEWSLVAKKLEARQSEDSAGLNSNVADVLKTLEAKRNECTKKVKRANTIDQAVVDAVDQWGLLNNKRMKFEEESVLNGELPTLVNSNNSVINNRH